jgi:hypothetical protein
MGQLTIFVSVITYLVDSFSDKVAACRALICTQALMRLHCC